MDKKKVISDLQESVVDVLKNLNAVKGEAYADTVTFAHMGLHFARLIKQISVMHDVPNQLQEMLFHQHSQLMHAGLMSIYDAHGMSDETFNEILEWASKLDDKIDQALEHLSQES
jgi:hypothetical protein